MMDEGLTPSTQVAPLRHGLGAHSSMSTSQFRPLEKTSGQITVTFMFSLIALQWKVGDLGGDGHDRTLGLPEGGGS